MKNEVWAIISEHPQYEISNLGRVRRLETMKILTPMRTGKKRNYLSVALHHDGKRFTCKIHHLVLEAFVGNRPSESYQTNHKNCDPLDNSVNNLEWVTQFENMKHAKLHNLLRPRGGEAHGRSRLTIQKVKEIRELKEKTNIQLSRIFGVGTSTISRVRRFANWKDIGCKAS